MTGFIKTAFGSKAKETSNDPKWVQEAGADIYKRGQTVADQPYQGYDGKRVADQSYNQNLAANLAKSQIGRFDNDYSKINDYWGDSAAQYDQTYTPTEVTARDVAAQKWTDADVNEYMNPYLAAALQPQIDATKEDYAIRQNQANAKAAGSGSFGGSRAGINSAIITGQEQDKVNNVRNIGYNDAYNTALSAFNADANRDLSAQTSNQGKDVNLGRFNEDSSANAFKTNYGIFSDNAQRSAEAARGLDSLVDTKSGVTDNILKSLQSTGASQQLIDQLKLDSNYKNFTDERDYKQKMTEFLSGLLKENPSNNSITTTGKDDNGIGNMIKTAATIALSDRRLKTEIVKVGEKDGINIYDFNYIGQPERYRGVMAQEVEHIEGAVVEVDGYKMVDYSKLPVKFEKVIA